MVAMVVMGVVVKMQQTTNILNRKIYVLKAF